MHFSTAAAAVVTDPQANRVSSSVQHLSAEWKLTQVATVSLVLPPSTPPTSKNASLDSIVEIPKMDTDSKESPTPTTPVTPDDRNSNCGGDIDEDSDSDVDVERATPIIKEVIDTTTTDLHVIRVGGRTPPISLSTTMLHSHPLHFNHFHQHCPNSMSPTTTGSSRHSSSSGTPMTLSPRSPALPGRPDSTSSVSSSASSASASSFEHHHQHHHHHNPHLFHPFYHHPGHSQHMRHRNNINYHHNHRRPNVPDEINNEMPRTLKFSIENILRPDFGRVALDPTTTTTTTTTTTSTTTRTGSGNEDSGDRLHTNRQNRDKHHHQHHQKSNHKITSKTNSKPNRPSTSTTVNNNGRLLSSQTTASLPTTTSPLPTSENSQELPNGKQMLWPAWVYCTRYSDRPSSGPRSRRMKKKEKKPEEKRPRTAFTNEQLARLKKEFQENRYLTEKRRQDLARELQLNESQIKIWFQNKRAKIKKASGQRNGLALSLMAQGLYNHSTSSKDEEGFIDMQQEQQDLQAEEDAMMTDD